MVWKDMDDMKQSPSHRPLMKVIGGECLSPPPIWMMRQAGRYLPEYKETRKKAGGFLDLCYNPELAIEVTMQPIRRFGFDAAILFSDILVIPDALKVNVRFEEGVGPIVETVDPERIARLSAEDVLDHLNPVLQTVEGLRQELPDLATLIGFCGAPWTVATYMIAGRGTPDQGPARQFALNHPAAFSALMDVLVDASSQYLIAQLRAGADVVQIFDSWASVLDEDQFEKWCIQPVSKIVQRVRQEIPDAKIVGFPKGIGAFYLDYQEKTGVDMVGLDWALPMSFAKKLQSKHPVQGNLDPKRLIVGGNALNEGVDRILEHLGSGPLVFNLGHGITPETSIAHVEQMVERVRSFKNQ